MSGRAELLDDPRILLELAQSDPIAARVRGWELLRETPDDQSAVLAMVHRALGIAYRAVASMDEAIEQGELSVRHAAEHGDPALLSQSLLSLAGSWALSGDNTRALSTLTEASALGEGELRAEIEFQRGATLARMGEADQALACFGEALPVYEEMEDRESIAMTLHNRAMVRMQMGDLHGAATDLGAALSIDETDGRPFPVAGEMHGLGTLAWLRGDLPQALALLDQSGAALQALVGSALESQVSRVEVLLSAGLFREASTLAGEIVREMRRSGLAEDEAEAHLVAAQAALLSGSHDDAVARAERAEGMFTGQERFSWAAAAHLVALQARAGQGEVNPGLIDQARRLTKVLDERGHHLPAIRARFLTASIARRLGRNEEARRALAEVADQSTGPIEIRLQAHLARARVRLMDGDATGADAAARAGLDLLHRYQAAIGATDIRFGLERHARDLADLGLRLGMESRRARRVFSWMERSKSTALTHRPVAPPSDPELTDELASLRQVVIELRGAGDNVAGDLLRQERRLQESIRSRARRVSGQDMARSRMVLSKLADHLGKRTLIELASVDGELWSVLVRNGRYHLRRIGPEAAITSELQSLRFVMRRLTRGRGSPETAAEVARRLDALLFGRLRPSGPLVIVPTAELHVTPWWALPTSQERSLTIAPSARLWLQAMTEPGTGGGVVVAAGPQLDLSDEEVAEVGDVYQASTLLSSTDSDPVNVQRQLDGAAVAHIASHASFQHENPMFSSLRLAGGDLYVYDLERLAKAPDIVVLSACDSGFTDTYPGEEMMGLSSALLSMGTRSVVASVGLVPDSEATKHLMVALHTGLAAGLAPSVALHRAQSEIADTPEGYVAAASFVCIGAG